MLKQTTRSKALFYAILSTCFSSTAILFQSLAAKELSLFQILAVVNILGGLTSYAIIIIKGEKINYRGMLDHKFELLMILFCRFLTGGVLFWMAMRLTVGVKAIFFTKAEPYFVLLWGCFLDGATVPAKHLLLLLVHFVGAVFLSGGDFAQLGTTQVGDLILVLAVSILALSYRYAGKLGKNTSSFHYSTVLQLVAGAIFLPFAFLTTSSIEWIGHGSAWLNLFASIILWNILGLPLWFSSLKSLEGWLVSALRAVGPLVATPIAFLFFDQTLTLMQGFGAFVVLATSFWLAREKNH